MIIKLEDFRTLPKALLGGALTIGNFDGVHRGHLAIVEQVRRLAQEVSGPSVVFTFDPPPAKLLRPTEAPEALTQIERRAEILAELGIDFVVVCPTTWELLQLEPEDFFRQVIQLGLQAKAVAEGENFCFGRQRRGDVAMLKQLCEVNGMRFRVLEPQQEGGQWISSSRIRSLLEAGDIQSANRLLVGPYRISGVVSHGAARGRTLGFPTANLESIPVLVPPPGVYAGRVESVKRCDVLQDSPAVGKTVAINVGPNPTFGESKNKVEVHIIDFSGDLYGDVLTIELIDKIRDVQKFQSIEHLQFQLKEDIQKSQLALRAHLG